jgi:hypothetical protein
MTERAGSGSVSRRYESEDPDRYQKVSRIRNTASQFWESGQLFPSAIPGWNPHPIKIVLLGLAEEQVAAGA